MAISVEHRTGRRLEFSASELTGALGDSVTVLPVVVALGVLTPVSLSHALLAFGVFQIVWGALYGLPVSVEPMKALAGLAIAGTITYPELAAAGLLAGGVLLVAGRAGALGRLRTLVGRPVVRGVQLAVALLLARAGLDLALSDPGLALAGGLLALLAVAAGYGRASALLVLGAGTALAVAAGLPAPRLPGLAPVPAPAVTGAALEGTAAQLAMTVGNAAVATSLLFSDLFDADVSPDDLAGSMGAMNLVAVPLGGVPMCHGSGGLAGKYAFGARTGGANLVLGALYVGAALVAGVWSAFPLALLGALLGVVALQLARVALDAERRWLVVGVGLLGLANVGLAFVVGALAHLATERARRADDATGGFSCRAALVAVWKRGLGCSTGPQRRA